MLTKTFEDFSKHLDIPIINGLTSDLSHPCTNHVEILLTFEELRGPIQNKKIAWVRRWQ